MRVIIATIFVMAALQAVAGTNDLVYVQIRTIAYDANEDKLHSMTNFTGYATQPFKKGSAVISVDDDDPNKKWYNWGMKRRQLKKNGFTKAKFITFVSRIAANPAHRAGTSTNISIRAWVESRGQHFLPHP